MTDFHPVIAAIVRDCLQFDPSERPTANEVAERLVRWQFRATDLNRDEYGNTELHQMVTSKDYITYMHIHDLFYSGKPVMVNAVNHLGETLLMRAEDCRIIKTLLKYRKVLSSNEEPSRVAEYNHNIDVFGALRGLAEKQNIEQVKLIVESSESVPAIRLSTLEERAGPNGETALHIAAKIGNIALLDALMGLEAGSVWKPDNDGRTALHVASLNGHSDILERLIALTGDSKENGKLEVHRVNTQDKIGKTPLHLAATSGNISTIRVLLACSAINVNQRDFDQRTPMFDVLLADYTDESSRNEVFQAFADHVDTDLRADDSTGEVILHKCARQDLTQSVEFLLNFADIHMSMNVREKEHNYAPIHLSVREKSFRVASILLAKWDRDVNESDKYGNTLLHLLAAASFPSTDASDKTILIKRSPMVRFAETLISRDDMDLNLCNLRGDTPFHVAIENNNLTVVQKLLTAPCGKLRINQRDKKGRTPLLLAIDYDRADFARMILLRKDVDVNVADTLHQTPLHLTSEKNMPEITRMILLKSDVDANARNNLHQTPLHRASEYNASEVATILISRDDVDVKARDKSQQTPLHIASKKNALEVATTLISRNEVDVNARDERHQTPLHLASRTNADKVAMLLLSRDEVDVNARDDKQQTPLHLASWWNVFKVRPLFFSSDDVNANARDDKHQTPLHVASANYAYTIAKLLLSRDDVDVNARDIKQKTPLHEASRNNATKVAALLLSRDDVDVNARDERHQTPLHEASRENHDGVAALFLSRNDVDVNARDQRQWTPLHCASWGTSYRGAAAKVMALLLKRDDVDVGARDADGKTSLEIATAKGATKCIKLLRAASLP